MPFSRYGVNECGPEGGPIVFVLGRTEIYKKSFKEIMYNCLIWLGNFLICGSYVCCFCFARSGVVCRGLDKSFFIL